MRSGNDAANTIAEMISGSTEAFAQLMNEEAQALGATNSHFVNPHGLSDEEHYTTLYDLYLIFQAAVSDDTFCTIINTGSHTATYQNSAGETVTAEWSTTNRYLKGEQEAPEGVTVVGGKTGTTDAAGYCLVLYSKDDSGTPYISIVLKGDSRDDLYVQMNELLALEEN
jgi:D-alanyl-D-alanine carboxypeptidase (penicillin-binding protein 5/6)